MYPTHVVWANECHDANYFSKIQEERKFIDNSEYWILAYFTYILS